ncbi:HD-GYP domain-containing protein [Halarcobacter ebronensis]|uniref:HD family phosphohydrolase n=1 Tax=Halarcobacter ebronensis TaxID=1462615 RepID=A0A4Q1AR81_9BACT|nr:response regulator c-di-GMP phosphodiesterase, RpfG family [Halarcobacter ebronensis]RXK08307.1 HD family phosphohydrolase [Halarcobacter ebronensis]
MNIKKVVKYTFTTIVVLILATFFLNGIILNKLKENNDSRKEISKLVLMQENMNLLIKDTTTTNNQERLKYINNEFSKYEKSFEELKNSLMIRDKDDFLDFFIKDIHKNPKILKHLILLSKSEVEIEEGFEKIHNLQSQQIRLKSLFSENYPKENLLRENIEKDILKTEDIFLIKNFSDIKYYSKEVLFQYKEKKYLDTWIEKIQALSEVYNNKKLSKYLDTVKTLGDYVIKLNVLEIEEESLQNNIYEIINRNKELNLKIEAEIEAITSSFITNTFTFMILLLLVTILIIILLAIKVNKNVALSFNQVEQKVQEGLSTIKHLNNEIEETQREVVFTMGAIGESRSKETGNHVKRVAEYSKVFALYYGLAKEEAEMLKQASPMHDIGKVAIPDSILNKPGRFDEKERGIMNTHALLGYEMLKHSKRSLLKCAATVAYEHHEKWDGTGYPRGLKGEDIHIYGRITALADVFDALGSDRCYKKAWDDEKIFNLFKEERGKHFDPKLVDIFFEHLDEFLKIRETFKDKM